MVNHSIPRFIQKKGKHMYTQRSVQKCFVEQPLGQKSPGAHLSLTTYQGKHWSISGKGHWKETVIRFGLW